METTHWIEAFAKQNLVALPNNKPGYWDHPLLRHLGMPDSMPTVWHSVEPQLRFSILLLESFCPPANLMGLMHQLPAMRHIVSSVPDQFKEQAKDAFNNFADSIRDFYVYHATNAERNLLGSRRLRNLKKLGIWRFHFHCAQVDRKVLGMALGAGMGKNEILVASKIPYLRAGQLDPIYQRFGVIMHQSLRKRLQDKLEDEKEPDSWEDQLRLVYNESLLCERALLSAHMLVPEGTDLSDSTTWSNQVWKRMRTFGHTPEDLLRKMIEQEPEDLQPFIPYLGRAYRFIKSHGKYRPKRQSHRKRTISFRQPTHRIGRLVPPGMFDESDEEGHEIVIETNIEEPLNILLGVSDDRFTQANLKRHYGISPRLPKEVGESTTDYGGAEHLEIPVSWVTDPYQQYIKQRVQAESLILALDPPIWSPPALMIKTVKNYLQVANQQNGAVRFLASLALFTGMSQQDLSNVHIGFPDWARQIIESGLSQLDSDAMERISQDRKRSHVYLEPDAGSYGYAMKYEQVAYYSEASHDFAKDCVPSTFMVVVALPSPARKFLDQWIKSEPERFQEAVTNAKPLFTRRDMAQWAEVMSEAGRMSHENITPARIRATFRSLFSGQMGMAPIYADLVSKSIPIQHRAQHFYSAVDLSRLNQRYKTTATEIHALLTKEDSPEIQNQEGPRTIPSFAGSRIVPQRAKLAQYFRELHASFAQYFETRFLSAEAWNRMMLFLYRLFQLSTGLRPMRDALPNWRQVSLATGWMHISDKNNLHFFEARLVPLSSRLLAWLSWLDRHSSRFMLDLNLIIEPVSSLHGRRISEEIFIHASDDGIARPMTMDNLLSTESSIPLSQPWTWKQNALRHYFLSSLLDAGADQRLIDSIMGHKHYGNEPFGRFSMMHPSRFALDARQLIDQHIIAPLDIPEPPAWQ